MSEVAIVDTYQQWNAAIISTVTAGFLPDEPVFLTIDAERLRKPRHKAHSGAQRARRASTSAEGDSPDRGRWFRRSKTEAVLRFLRGETIDALSRELVVTRGYPAKWRNEALAAMQAGLQSREPEQRRLHPKAQGHRKRADWLPNDRTERLLLPWGGCVITTLNMSHDLDAVHDAVSASSRHTTRASNA